ncbi:MAG: YciI family protein, partial [Actinomycetota bacterium]|nr:YciI family protein [Actinomycetota bacterium]
GEYMAFTESIVESGEFVSGDPLQGTDTATCVRLRDGQLSTTDGPFVETKEVLGGYYVVDVKDLDRAIELASQIPDSRTGAIEVRPVMDIPG